MKEFRLTSEVWQKAYLPYFAIFDPDGWDRRPDHFKRSWYEEKITRKEFLRRMSSSTCRFTRRFTEIPF